MTGEGLTGIDQGTLLAQSILNDGGVLRALAGGQEKEEILRKTVFYFEGNPSAQASFLKTLFQSLGEEGDTKTTDRRDTALAILTDTTKDGEVRLTKAIAPMVENNLAVVFDTYIAAVRKQTKDNDSISGSIDTLFNVGIAIAPLIRSDNQRKETIIGAWQRVARKFSGNDKLPYINLGIKNIEYVIYSDPRVEGLIRQGVNIPEIAIQLGITEWEVTQSARHFNAALKAERAVGREHAAKTNAKRNRLAALLRPKK